MDRLSSMGSLAAYAAPLVQRPEGKQKSASLFEQGAASEEN
jgi:hypothetical protein